MGHFNPPAIVRPQPERITKNVPGRAVDVNRPVTLWCVPDADLATRARTVTGGLTSPARLVTWGPVRKTTSGVLYTVSPSQPRPPNSLTVFLQGSRELQRHWAEAPGCDSHSRCAQCQERFQPVGSALRPQAAAMRLWGRLTTIPAVPPCCPQVVPSRLRDDRAWTARDC